MTEHPTAQELPLAEAAILLRPDDDVAIATRDLTPGLALRYAGGVVAVGTTVPRAHKLALRAIPAGGQVHKYGQSIGRATRDIAAGEHVHAHNLAMDNTAREHEFGTARVTPPDTMRGRTFLGYRRPDGRVGTRNFIGVGSGSWTPTPMWMASWRSPTGPAAGWCPPAKAARCGGARAP